MIGIGAIFILLFSGRDKERIIGKRLLVWADYTILQIT